MNRSKGVTLLELLVTIAVLAVLTTIAIPSFRDMGERRRVVNASEAIYSDLQFARSEAVKRSHDVKVEWGGAGLIGCSGWFLQMWDVTTNPDEYLTHTCGDGFPQITLTDTEPGTDARTFDRIRGMPGEGVTLILKSPSGYQIEVVLSGLGRVRSCSPSGTGKVWGYPSCT